MIHTIVFNRQCCFSSQHGVEFFNLTTAKHPISFSTDTILPSDCIVFHVEWENDPQKGEHIKWLYDGTGTYCGTDGVHMLLQDLDMINCADHEDDDCPVAAYTNYMRKRIPPALGEIKDT